MNSNVSLSLIHLDLRKEEAIVQIAQNLEILKTATDKVFTETNYRISQLKEEINQINARGDKIKLQISQIKQLKNKEICVYSPNQYYPSKCLDKNYKSFTSFVSKQQCSKPYEKINQPHEIFHDGLLNQKLHVYNLQSLLNLSDFTSRNLNAEDNKDSNDFTINDQSKAEDNLNIENNMNLEYSGENEPRQQETTENKESTSSVFKSIFKLDENESSIFDTLPSDLPDLEMIASDSIVQTNTSNEKIQPTISSVNQTISNTLPSNRATGNKKNEEDLSLVVLSDKEQLMSSTRFDNEILDQSSNSSSFASSNASNPQTSGMSTSLLLPPPPPPPPPTSKATSPTFGQSLLQNENNRASLLEAIRKASGKPEKNTKKMDNVAKKETVQIEKKEEKVETPDLMQDLKKHLLSRRKGMEGKQEDKDNIAEKKSLEQPVTGIFGSVNRMLEKVDSSASSTVSEEDNDWMD